MNPLIKRSFIAATALVLAASALTGCSKEQTNPGSQGTSSLSSQSQEQVQKGDIPLTMEGVLTFYQSRTQTTYGATIEEKTIYLPVDKRVEQGLTAQVLNDLIDEAGMYTPYWVEQIEEKDGVAVVNISGEPNPDFENRMFYDTIAMTLLQSCPVQSVSFLLDGAPAPLQAQQQDSTAFTPATLNVPKLSQKEYTQLRQQVPYSQVVEKYRQQQALQGYDYTRPIDSWDLKGDARAKKILDTIANITRLNIPETDFLTIEEAPNHFIQMAALVNVPSVYWGQVNEFSDVNTYPQLEPLEEAVWDFQGYLQEHVEQAAKELFGPEVTLTHTNKGLSPWQYHEYAGVYTPPHMGTPYPTCYLLDYTKDGATITATVAYSAYFTGFGGVDEAEQLLAGEMGEEAFVTQRAERHSFTLRQSTDGKLYLTGHKLLGNGNTP